MAVADFNGDGRPDVGLTYLWLPSGVSIPAYYTGTADGGLAPADDGGARTAEALLLGDFDGDGSIDWYSAGYDQAFAQGIAPGLTDEWSEADGPAASIASADFDHDGKLDVVSGPSLEVRYSTGPQLLPSDANTDLGEAQMGSGGPILAVSVRNEGGGVARDLRPVVEGDADDFSVDLDRCRGAVLVAGAQCWIYVHFRPTTTGDREADIGLVAPDSGIVREVPFVGTGVAAPDTQPEQPVQPVSTVVPGPNAVVRIPSLSPVNANRSTPVKVVRPGVPAVARTTLAALLGSGLRFTQTFGTAEPIAWTLELHGTVVARATRTVAVGRVTVTLKPTAAGKGLLRKRHPGTLTLRTRATLTRTTTVRLR